MNGAVDPIRIAMVGTRGVPARYGGFETCVEEVGRRLADRGHLVTVYCRRVEGQVASDNYEGMQLVHLPALKRRSLETLSHTALSVSHLLRHRTDAVVMFNAANSPFLPLLRAARIPVATHVDGLEWMRAKWGPIGQRYYRAAESLSVKWSDALIADASGIQQYYTDEFAVDTELISYGVPLVAHGFDRLPELSIQPDGYHLVVARFEPENHVYEIVDGYVRSNAKLPLVVVGSAPYANDYTDSIRRLGDSRVRFLGGVWDQNLLDQLYGNARSYLHGHSVGGTNPSLLRAIGAGAPTTAFDVIFNREVLGDAGTYFSTPEDVQVAIQDVETNPAVAQARGDLGRTRAAKYSWDEVATAYEGLCQRLAVRSVRRPPRPVFRQRSAHSTRQSTTSRVRADGPSSLSATLPGSTVV
jgi:glycosyltransferase involved in cell wall biosynthesis